jgi:hypothetical protein
VPFEPSHPDEPVLHSELRDALNQRLTSTNFFVWIGVTPSGTTRTFENLDRIVQDTERWLASLDPGALDPKNLPSEYWMDAAGEVEIPLSRSSPRHATTELMRSWATPCPPCGGGLERGGDCRIGGGRRRDFRSPLLLGGAHHSQRHNQNRVDRGGH